jgi:septum site-determining protein MinC
LTVEQSVLELKGEMLMLNVLRLQDVNIEQIEAVLQQKRNEAPMFFIQSPIVVDCSDIEEEQSKLLDLRALRRILVKMDFVPVGLRGISNSLLAASMTTGWNVLRSPTKRSLKLKKTTNIPLNQVSLDDKNSQDRAISVTKSEVEDVSVSLETPVETLALGLTVDRPVRSGQQVYAKNGDLIVLSQTSAGSEVMADGSIHVYGPLRGRVLAGVKGDKTARIFCRSLEAELIVIAGCYQLLDESKTDLKGKPAMIRLEDEKLIIESLD